MCVNGGEQQCLAFWKKQPVHALHRQDIDDSHVILKGISGHVHRCRLVLQLSPIYSNGAELRHWTPRTGMALVFGESSHVSSMEIYIQCISPFSWTLD